METYKQLIDGGALDGVLVKIDETDNRGWFASHTLGTVPLERWYEMEAEFRRMVSADREKLTPQRLSEWQAMLGIE